MGLSSAAGLKLFSGLVTLIKVPDARNAFGTRSGLRAAEQKRSLDDFPALELPVLLNDLAVKEGDEEGSDDKSNTTTDTEGDTDGLIVSELDLG